MKDNNKEQKATCDKCGIYCNEVFIFRTVNKGIVSKERKSYCGNCLDPSLKAQLGVKKELMDSEPVSQEKFDNFLDACISTPPIRYKDLKARLKKEREEKKKRNEASFR